MKVAIVRGKFLNRYEMQFFEPLAKKYDITAFSSLTPFHDKFTFPVIKLPSPMDLPEFPYKMPILNRLFVDAQYLFGLEHNLKGFDIVHTAETYYHYTRQALNAKKKGYVKKVVVTVLENIPFNNEGIWGRKESKKRAREELDHIIALTQRTKATLLLEGADEKKITVIGHFIDTKRFYPTTKMNVGKQSVNILFTGRLETYKGVYEILYAAKLLLLDKSLKKYTIHFTFVGMGSEYNHMLFIERLLGISGHITHKEVTYEKMPEEYRNADIFVAPSKASKYWIEQYNTGLLEAQASGIPIVTTMSGGILENVKDAAILIGPNDFYALSQEIKEFILSPKKRLAFSKKARERAVKVHDISIGAKKIAGVYERVMGK